MKIEGRVESINHQFMGIIKAGKREMEVPFTTPGDLVEVIKWKRKKGRYIATEYRIIERSKERMEPVCPYFGVCGGCRAQHIPYSEQLELKEEFLREVLGMEIDVKPSPRIYGHRNRIDMVTSTKGIGFRRFGTWWDVVDIDECKLFGPASGEAIRSLREFVEDLRKKIDEPLYRIKENRGFLRYMVLREGKFTGELMINLVTSEGDMKLDPEQYFDYADSIYWSINRTKSDVSFGDVERFWGREFIEEKVLGVVYRIHPNSFFQTNSYQLENLLRDVREMVEGSRVLDAYSGIGTFGVFLAKNGAEVKGFDVNREAVRMANMNAGLNGVTAEFRVLSDREPITMDGFESAVVDPPRPGLHPRFRRLLARKGPEVLVYVSCNPSTLSRDLRELESSYTVEEIRGLDMFPHTPHVEVVVKMRRKLVN